MMTKQKVEEFNVQLGLMASAVDMWQQKLKEKRPDPSYPSRNDELSVGGSKSEEPNCKYGETPIPFIFHGIRLIFHQIRGLTKAYS